MAKLLRTMMLALLALGLLPLTAQAWIRSPATAFGKLPPGTAHPEGLALGPDGDLYVANFDVSGTRGHVVVFDGNSGRLLRTLTLTTGTNPQPSNLLLGLDFHPTTHQLLVIDFGNKNVLSVNQFTGVATLFMTLPPLVPSTPAPGLNGLTFDTAGNVYVSDSFRGTIWRTGRGGGVATQWVTHPLLTATGVPPFGANGIAFNSRQTALFVANTGDDTVVKIPVSGSPLVAGTPFVLSTASTGPTVSSSMSRIVSGSSRIKPTRSSSSSRRTDAWSPSLGTSTASDPMARPMVFCSPRASSFAGTSSS